MQNAIKETLYLLAIAGMEESIVEGGEAPISECLDECEVIEQLKRESYADGYRDGSRKVIIDCYKKRCKIEWNGYEKTPLIAKKTPL